MNCAFADRREWFQKYVQRIELGHAIKPRLGVRYPCPCCGYPTLEVRVRGYEICNLCGWEDDGQDDPHSDEVWGGPNYELSLTQARDNFERYLDKYQPEQALMSKLGGTNSLAQEKAKLEIVSAFDSMVGETTTEAFDTLWEQVYTSQQILEEELYRKVREYEASAGNN